LKSCSRASSLVLVASPARRSPRPGTSGIRRNPGRPPFASECAPP